MSDATQGGAERPRHRSAWRLWAKALGEKSGANDAEADTIALIRTAIVTCYVVTNMFIVAGIIRHW